MGKKLGSLIRAARTDAGLTQVKLAEQIPGVSGSDIGRYERGEAEPTQQVVKAIAKACGVTQKSLLDAMPKTTARTSGSSSAKTTSSSTTSVKLTATEKRLVELYRAADTDTRKKAMQVLKGEEATDITALLSTLGKILGKSDLSGILGNAGLGTILGSGGTRQIILEPQEEEATTDESL